MIDNKKDQNMDWGLKKIIKIYGLFIYDLFFFKFIKSLIKNGKGLNSIYLFNKILLNLKKLLKMNIHYILSKVFFNIKPLIYLRTKRIRKRIYKFGIKIYNEKKHLTFTIKWLIKLLRDRNKTRVIKQKELLNILYDSFFNKGLAIEAKVDFYNIALDSMPFIRYLKYNKKK